jgi:hypothetical protein
VSSVGAVVAALVNLGEATLDGDEWQVIDGPANTVTTVRDRVLAVGADEIVSLDDADSYAGASFAERYTVPLIISVSLPGPDALAAARVEALAVHEEFYNAVRDSPGRNLGLSAEGVIDVPHLGASHSTVCQRERPVGRSPIRCRRLFADFITHVPSTVPTPGRSRDDRRMAGTVRPAQFRLTLARRSSMRSGSQPHH